MTTFISICSMPSVSAVSVSLDFAGANFLDHFTDPGTNTVDGQIRWNNIARDPSKTGRAGRIDLVATVAAGSNYDFGGGPPNLQGNGSNGVASGATRLKLAVGTEVIFDFNFFDGNGNAVEVTTSFALFDFDETTRTGDGVTVDEIVTFSEVSPADTGSFTYATAGLINIDTSNSVAPVFSSGVEGNQADNPTDLSNLTSEQELKTVQFDIVDSTGFTLGLEVGGTPPAADPDSARTFFIGDAIDFNLSTTTILVPEPSTMCFILMAGFTFGIRRR